MPPRGGNCLTATGWPKLAGGLNYSSYAALPRRAGNPKTDRSSATPGTPAGPWPACRPPGRKPPMPAHPRKGSAGSKKKKKKEKSGVGNRTTVQQQPQHSRPRNTSPTVTACSRRPRSIAITTAELHTHAKKNYTFAQKRE